MQEEKLSQTRDQEIKETLEGWGQPQEASEVTIKELKNLCEKYREVRAKKAELEAQVKEVNKEKASIEAKMVEYLTENEMRNFSGEFGQIILTKRVSVRQPANPEDKEAFYNWLKEKGDFERLISVNSRTLTKYVRDEIDIKKSEGQYGFVPPGLKEPETTQTVTFKKG